MTEPDLAARVDAMVASIDERVGAELDAIFHHPAFQRLERSWRGLAFVVERTRFEENIRIEIVDCSKEDLAADLARGERVTASGLYQTLYARAYGRHGGEPYGAVIVDHHAGPEDAELLERCACLGYVAMAPFIWGASARLVGAASWDVLPAALALDPRVDALRDREESRAIGLVLPRFLLRAPFAVDGPELVYREGESDDEARCWGNAGYAFATRLTESFALYRWCPNIVRLEHGGLVAGLPTRQHASCPTPIATEAALSDGREAELAAIGLVPLGARAGLDGACFDFAPSLQRMKAFADDEEGQARAMNFRLGGELPFFFILTRCMHYVSVAYYTRDDPEAPRTLVERDLNDWIGQYVANRDVLTSDVRRWPLRTARIIVTETEHADDWYKLDVALRPHFKHLGMFYTLSVTGRLTR